MAVGCGTENELQYRSSLDAETHGVALSHDGLDSYAAMVGTTCTIDTAWGCPTADEDLPTEDERVTDHYRGTTLAVSDEGVHLLRGAVWDGETSALAQVRTAKLTDAGVLALGGSAEACWYHQDGMKSEVPASLCADGTTVGVDRRGGLVAATPDGVFAVDGEGVRTVHEDADLAAVDAVGGRTYVARRGERTLTALDDAGAVLWTTEASGPVVDIEVRGDKQDLVVFASVSDDLGNIERIDGPSGARRSSTRVPTTTGELVLSGNGHTLALVGRDTVHHFSFVIDGEDPVVRGESVDCFDLPVRQSQGFSTD